MEMVLLCHARHVYRSLGWLAEERKTGKEQERRGRPGRDPHEARTAEAEVRAGTETETQTRGERPEEVNHVVSRRGSSGGPDPVALIEIDLYGDLMIAASSADEDRLSADRIDEVLRVVPAGGKRED
ncbi:hypothetical protein AB0G83_26010 [Streptomyces klenkii]|uniref:hypothetical protein n=1 Tax=Streptomyces klenkii TaxID=1420899 RepID=UPI0011C46E3E|nr:hypothetical protein [Streptomyces klenkii]